MKKIFKRPYLNEFFNAKEKNKSSKDDDASTWVEEYIGYKEDKVVKQIKVELNKDEIIDLFYIISRCSVE